MPPPIRRPGTDPLNATRGLGCLVGFLILVGILAAACLPEAVDERRSFPKACSEGSASYSARSSCEPGGESVVVARVIDGDTLELENGRQIQLIGVDAPEADECGGVAAVSFIRRALTDQVVRIYEDAESTEDRVGRPLRYIRYGESAGATKDLAYGMLKRGLVRRFPAYAGNPTYTIELETVYQAAAAELLGIYGAACGRAVSPLRVTDDTSDENDDKSRHSSSEQGDDRFVAPTSGEDDDEARPRVTTGENGSKDSDEDQDEVDPYPGYTGPRCYLPGGKTYRPC
jgi:endonuclease YncB( thermonuclease family)